jgi:hypothetical protein
VLAGSRRVGSLYHSKSAPFLSIPSVLSSSGTPRIGVCGVRSSGGGMDPGTLEMTGTCVSRGLVTNLRKSMPSTNSIVKNQCSLNVSSS